MSDISELAGRKVAGLPAGAWAVAILGGLGISMYLRRNGGSADQVDPGTVAPGTSDTGGLGGAAVSDPSNAPGTPPTTPTSPEDAGSPTVGYAITTNGQWRQQAVKYLVGLGHSPIYSEGAVAAYIAGRPMSHTQADYANQAVAGIGPTPQAVPAIHIVPVLAHVKAPVKKVPAKKPAKKPAKRHHPAKHHKPIPRDAPHHPGPRPHARVASPIAHHTHPTATQHARTTPHPNTRRDTGRATNPHR